MQRIPHSDYALHLTRNGRFIVTPFNRNIMSSSPLHSFILNDAKIGYYPKPGFQKSIKCEFRLKTSFIPLSNSRIIIFLHAQILQKLSTIVRIFCIWLSPQSGQKIRIILIIFNPIGWETLWNFWNKLQIALFDPILGFTVCFSFRNFFLIVKHHNDVY